MDLKLPMLEEVHKNIYLVDGNNNGRFPFSYSVLITGKITALLDTGCGMEILKAVDREFAPEIVIFSHAHPDHCSGSSFFPAEKLWGPEESRETTGDLSRMAGRFIEPHLHGEWISFMRESVEFNDFKVGNFFGRDHVFDFGGTLMEAVHAPGHTNDHYCFYFPHEKTMLTTDIDFTSFGPWYGNPESDIDGFINSIDRVRNYDLDVVISSHLGVIRDGIQDRFAHFLNVFEERDRKILEFLNVPRSIEEFVENALIYQKYAYRPSILRWWELKMVNKHLDRFMSKGLVERVGDKFVRIV